MAFRVDQDTNYDELFAYLERVVNSENPRGGDILFSPVDMDERMLFSCVRSFVERFRRMIGAITYNFNENSIHVQPAKRLQLREGGYRYDELPQTYDDVYYLNDCGGWDTFQHSGGKRLDVRLGQVLEIMDPRPEDVVLDLGCGRGELSYHLSELCKSVRAIDYSEDAIRIAKKMFGASQRSNLTYTCADAVTLPLEREYDKVVMSDVYEHIDASVMEKLLPKIASVLKDTGKLFIHTAPNLDWYETVYPQLRANAMRGGAYLPADPRSYYEKLMHINEQRPRTLYETLRRFFPHVIVWTGEPKSEDDLNKFPVPAIANDMFAVASASDLRAFTDSLFMESLASDQLRFSVSVVSSQRTFARFTPGQLLVRVTNLSSVPIQSRMPYPVYVAYHILRSDGSMAVFDGKRTALPRRLYPGESADVLMELDVGAEAGRFRVRVTMVQEQVLWMDSAIGVYEDIDIEVS